jgi:Protein of unknown function (DUF3307)
MLSDLFILMVLGHLVGDFMLQPKYTAMHKGDNTREGYLLCTAHVLIYSTIVFVLVGSSSPLVFVLVYVPHWVIDKWSLATYWTRTFRGRTFQGAYDSVDKYKSFDIAFTCIVYTVVDMTMHLLCLLGLTIVILKFGLRTWLS